jgi:hypothetical protein
VAGVSGARGLDDVIHDAHVALERERNCNAALRESLQSERDTTAALRGTVGRLEDTIEKLLGYTQCGCGEDEEGNYGQCVPCRVRDEGIYP